MNTKALLSPRKARAEYGARDAWWYVNKRSIEVLAQPNGSNPTCVKLTKKQLQRALEIMNESE